MARWAWLLAVVALLGAAAFFLLPKDKSAPRAPSEEAHLPAERSRSKQLVSTRATEDEDVAARGSVSGSVSYTDDRPAGGLSISIDAVLRTTTGPDGRFRFEHVRPGPYLAHLGDYELRGFHLLAGEHRTLDFRVPRFAHVSGIITAAYTLEPLEEILVQIHSAQGRALGAAHTDKDGQFHFGQIPEGRHSLVVLDAADSRLYAQPLAAYETQRLPCVVGEGGGDLQIRLERARPLSIRFERVPEAWYGELRFALRFRDRAGQLVDLGWGSGEEPLWLNEDGGLKYPPPEPPPGEYELSLEAPLWFRPIPWLSQRLFVPGGPMPPPEQTIRLPEGAPVTLISDDQPGGLGPSMRIGPVMLFFPSAKEARFPYVPEGQHGIWIMRPDHEIRVGELNVLPGHEIRYQLPPSGTATLRGRPDPYGKSPAELRTLDGLRVARAANRSGNFAFVRLQPGSYVLVLGERRIPVQLAVGQDLDLGVLR
ncbi:MAG: carboxypeptidase regulatory-like domain-containing protein [Planctomycetota bacterium]|nr:carboxypeptidase regulatory-like domain-containing protein [Planctomycetota bacterium]